MERKRMTDKNRPIRWKKTGGGGFVFKGHLIKPGQVFTAYVEEIPKGFRDLCVPLEELPAPPPPPPIEITKSAYEVKPRGESKVWFDVVDSKGKVINEKALKKEAAEQFAKDLAG
jgi:hypothetical protein